MICNIIQCDDGIYYTTVNRNIIMDVYYKKYTLMKLYLFEIDPFRQLLNLFLFLVSAFHTIVMKFNY
jgi:hypothetical protein